MIRCLKWTLKSVATYQEKSDFRNTLFRLVMSDLLARCVLLTHKNVNMCYTNFLILNMETYFILLNDLK